MRILVYEFVSGGGLAGRAVRPSLLHEGRAMRDALVEDLAALGAHEVVTTADPRFPLRRAVRGVEVVSLHGDVERLDALFRTVDAVWLVAPETGGCLERLAARAARTGVRLLGPTAGAIRRAADKGALSRRLARWGVPHPRTVVVRSPAQALRAAHGLGFPVVVKPARGAGCDGVSLARREGDVARAFGRALGAGGATSILVQRYVAGTAASVAILSSGSRSRVLAVSGQEMAHSKAFAYSGGRTPFTHPEAARAGALARRTCRSLPGLKGYVGVDVVLTGSGVVVIEVNPRLTTSYLGLRAALGENVAALALGACVGRLGEEPRVLRSVRFTSAGRVRSA